MATSDITDTDSTYIQYIVYVVIAAIAIASAIYLRKRSMIARTG
jgi:hypothetical protein